MAILPKNSRKMKGNFNLLILFVLWVIVLGCGNDAVNSSSLFEITFDQNSKGYTQEQAISISINDKKGKGIESISYSLDGQSLTQQSGNSPYSLSLEELKMGKRLLSAQITSDGATHNITRQFTMVASKPPTLYTFQVLQSYPHDMEAYTQGLEFVGDTLYESTGQRTESTLRKTDYTTGEVLKSVKLGDQFFGEGLTILNDKIYQLTWQKKTGFIYDLASMEQTGSFVYGNSQQGWGLCNDGELLYKSDGTEKIWTLSAATLAEQDYIEIYTHQSKIKNVNELEWVDGKIYANIYQKNAIAIVEPSSGAVEGVIDLKGLQEQVTQHQELDVLNGIAYKGEPGILYVTGKNWDKLFEIRIVEN